MAIGSEGVEWGLETLPLSLQEEPNAVMALLEQARPLVGQESRGMPCGAPWKSCGQRATAR